VLLGDADVEEAVRETGLEGQQTGGPGMAAVRATTRSSCSAACRRARVKASV
jgi:hypothetical protein